jgi:hypothetical protein
LLSSGNTWGLSRYSETLIAKKAGSTNAVVLAGGSVYVYTPGGTATGAETSGTTITMYDCSNFSFGDTIEVGSTGAVATVTSNPACPASSITVNTSLSWVAGDRILNTTTEATIYADEGGTTAITQPATADTSGRVTFFVDTSTTSEFDLVATASGGLRLVDYAVTLIGVGSSAGGWTDDGTTVRLTTSTDSVGIGTASTDGQLHLEVTDDQAFDVANPTAFQTIEGTTYGSKFQWYVADDGAIYKRDDIAGVIVSMIGDAGTGYHWFGDIENMSFVNTGVVKARSPGDKPGLVLEASATQTTPLLEIRDTLGTRNAYVEDDGGFAFAGITGNGTTITTSDPIVASETITANAAAYLQSTARITGLFQTLDDMQFQLENVTTSSHTADDEFIIYADTVAAVGAITINMPTCSSGEEGLTYAIYANVSAGNVTIDAAASGDIDNVDPLVLLSSGAARQSVIIACDGAGDWISLARFNEP